MSQTRREMLSNSRAHQVANPSIEANVQRLRLCLVSYVKRSLCALASFCFLAIARGAGRAELKIYGTRDKHLFYKHILTICAPKDLSGAIFKSCQFRG